MPLFLLMTMLLSAAPATPGSEQCDAKPFTLSKPVKPAAKPATEVPKKASEVASKAEAKPKPKAKPLADCDQPKKKG
jgi:hypothetical protein